MALKRVGVFNPVTRQISQTITVYGDKKIQFRDTGVYIHSSEDGKLKFSADAGGADDFIFSGGVTFEDDVKIDGSMTFGDAAVDTLTINGTLTANANATFQGDITVNEHALVTMGALTASYLVLNGTADNPLNMAGTTVNVGGADILLTNNAKVDNTTNGTLKLMTTASGYVSISAGSVAVKTDYLDLELGQALRFTGSGKNIDGDLVFRDSVTIGRSAAEVQHTLYGRMLIDGTADYAIRLYGVGSTFATGFDIEDGATTTGVKIGTCTTGIDISGSCVTAGINFVAAQLNCIKSVYNVGAQLGQYVQGIKIEHTRSADIQPSTGGWWGMQVVLNAGTGYTALDQPAYVIHGVFKGDATDPSTDCVNVARFETQSNGKVEDLLFVSANSGSTVTGDIARFVAHVAPNRAILALQNGTTGSTPAGLCIDADETMTSAILLQNSATVTNLLEMAASAPWSATNASGDGGKIAISVGGATKYLNVYNS